MAFSNLFSFCTSYDHFKEQALEEITRPMLCAGFSAGFGVVSFCTEDSCLRECTESTLRLADLQLAMEEASWSIRPWDSGSFGVVRKLQDALGNHGHVDLMHSGLHRKNVAVKKMPNSWVASGPWEFDEQNPEAEEKPWCDLGILWELNRLQFPYTCQLLGIFRDEVTTYVVTSLATEGDLFSWAADDPKPGLEREALMVPIMRQVFSAVQSLHDLGIAHRDLSMENILLTRDADGKMKVNIIDFAMSTISHICKGELRGKVVYRAPEMHVQRAYDAFLADNFSLGVVLFGTAVRDYPWSSTKPDACKSFSYVKQHGLRKLLEQRKLRNGNGERLIEVFSEPLFYLLEGLLDLDPRRRMCLGERAAKQTNEVQSSVWDSQWLAQASSRTDSTNSGGDGDSNPDVATFPEEVEAKPKLHTEQEGETSEVTTASPTEEVILAEEWRHTEDYL